MPTIPPPHPYNNITVPSFSHSFVSHTFGRRKEDLCPTHLEEERKINNHPLTLSQFQINTIFMFPT